MYISLIQRLTVLSLLCLQSIACANVDSAKIEHNNIRPNIVWLISEDNSTHYLKLYHASGASMPAIEKLAAEGLIFNNAYSNSPVCSTARTTLATGLYGTKLGTANHRAHQKVKLPDGFKPVSQILKEAGYYTTNNAKTDYNFTSNDKLWNESSRTASWKNRSDGQPFFHVQTFGITHEGKLHFKQGAIENAKTTHDPSKINIPPIYPDTPTFRYTYARTLDNHLKLDAQIANVIGQLEQEGELDNTVIFYFGDHGGVLPGSKGYLFETGLNIPLIIRIPEKFKHLVGNGLKQNNRRVDGFVSFIDFAPTLLDLAGINPPTLYDGLSFLSPGLDISALNKRETVFAQADRFDEKSDLVRSIRKGKYKYIRHYQPYYTDSLYNYYRYKQLAFQEWKKLYKAGKLDSAQSAFFKPKTPEALYDLSVDPYETNNLAADPDYYAILFDLRTELQEHLKAVPDINFIPESYVVNRNNGHSFNYARTNEKVIASLIDIADLQLNSFSTVKETFENLFKDGSELEKYWSLISLSHFGNEASEFIPKVKGLLNTEKSILIKGRAIEFLAMINEIDATSVLTDVIMNASHEIEKVELLNIATHLHEVKGLCFSKPANLRLNKPERGTPEFNMNTWLKTRWDYISACN